MNDAIKDGRSNSSIYILTARGAAIEQQLLELLRKHGITEIKQVFAVNENPKFDHLPNVAEKKKHVLNKIRQSHKGNEWLLSFNPTKDTDDAQEGRETKRAKLYQRVTKRMANKYGWDVVDIVRMDKHNIGFLMKRL